MALDNLLDPVSESAPCGPDLERRDDPEFLDYYFEAESRLPERYFTPGSAEDGREDRLFDPRSVDLAAERAAIAPLLARSRDLRLLSLLARFQILAGKLGDFASSLEDMAALMGQWPDELHPRVDRGAADRRSAIETLNSQPSVVMALVHLPLLPGSELTLRTHMVASGKSSPRLSETDLPDSDVLAPLRADSSQRLLAATNEQLSRAADALFRIQRLAQSHPEARFTPELGAVRTAIAEMQALIATARPELRPWSESAMPELPATPDPRQLTAPAPVAAQPPPHAAAPQIPDRATAAAALDAVQLWLACNEPSSPAVLLVEQARLLVGASLVEAIEVLMPDRAGAAVLDIGHGSGFSLGMDRLKTLSRSGLEGAADGRKAPAALPAITCRDGVAASLAGVEAYFSMREPASPIPLLLFKARDMLGKKFDAIMAELLVSAARTD